MYSVHSVTQLSLAHLGSSSQSTFETIFTCYRAAKEQNVLTRIHRTTFRQTIFTLSPKKTIKLAKSLKSHNYNIEKEVYWNV